ATLAITDGTNPIVSIQGGFTISSQPGKTFIAAAGINAFLGFGSVGVQVTNANLGVVIESNGFALNASGSAALVGVSALSVSGSLSVQIDTIPGSLNETVNVPDPQNPGQTIPVTVQFAAPVPLAFSGS